MIHVPIPVGMGEAQANVLRVFGRKNRHERRKWISLGIVNVRSEHAQVIEAMRCMIPDPVLFHRWADREPGEDEPTVRKFFNARKRERRARSCS